MSRDQKLKELVAKWRKLNERYWQRYSDAPKPADRRDFGLSDAFVTCADELEQILATPETAVLSERDAEWEDALSAFVDEEGNVLVDPPTNPAEVEEWIPQLLSTYHKLIQRENAKPEQGSEPICGTRLNPIAAPKSWICLLPAGHDGPCESNIDEVRKLAAQPPAEAGRVCTHGPFTDYADEQQHKFHCESLPPAEAGEGRATTSDVALAHSSFLHTENHYNCSACWEIQRQIERENKEK